MYRIVNRKKLLLTTLADVIGNRLRSLFGRQFGEMRIDPKTIRRILVIRTAYIGDVVMTLPIFGPLKTRFPDAVITCLTSASAASLLRNNPFIDEVVEIHPFWFYPGRVWDWIPVVRNLRKRRFDLVIEARGDIRDLLMLVFPLRSRVKISYAVGGGAFVLTHVVPHPGVNHRVDYHLDILDFLDIPTDHTKPEWNIYLTPGETDHIEALLKAKGISSPFWCAHPGSRVPLKRWMTDRYAETFDRIARAVHCPPVLLGSADEVAMVQDVSRRMSHPHHVLAGGIHLREMFGILSRSSLLVCNDSAPMHIAAVAGIPVVAIFGPSKSKQTGPFHSASIVVEKPFSCRNRCDETYCRNIDYHVCMKAITVSDVVTATVRLWCESRKSAENRSVSEKCLHES